ncbi:MAG: flagellar protein FliS [Gemmataceae bacterium]|nr:flagellar protein FliS [Gemmataceae bacterium]
MNRYAQYQQLSTTSATRIDLLLALFDGAIERIEEARSLIEQGRRDRALPLLVRAQMIVTELAAGVVLDVAPEMNANILRLYEYVAFRLAEGTVEGLQSAARVMSNLREGFRAIRAEAIEMERRGEIPPAESHSVVAALA